MPENEKIIEREMINHGIDVKKYKKENLLYVYHTTKTNQYLKGDPFDNLLRRIMPSDPAKICRIVGMLDFDMNTQEGMESFLKSEKKNPILFLKVLVALGCVHIPLQTLNQKID